MKDHIVKYYANQMKKQKNHGISCMSIIWGVSRVDVDIET
ncbi:hypothetical protein NARC_180033 [Candidatus Nitrosocosmicus arcticus]|uniref:Uncharacterized protein n=1 Tax=Candidatus Nitrosocosmicus arcticus TaxID=2035267 RepID=A0A557SRJ0_9ARCH|nr:hypothetical protein NARC_180033 [Candidatus Nitrosocosmicus arcticus]